VTVCVVWGKPQQLWLRNFGPQVKGSVRVNKERQAVKILCAAGGLNNQAHGYNHRWGRLSTHPISHVSTRARGKIGNGVRCALFRQCQRFKPVHMMIGCAELALDHRRAFEIMTDRELLRNPDAAVCLDRILANELSAA
jgi:hypothetical protein